MTVARKRRIVVDAGPPPVVSERISWRDWLLKRYARTWYWVGCLFLNIIILLEMPRSLGTGALLAGMVAAAAAVAQMAVCFRIWGRGGPLADDDRE